jgi:hyperosmotically inducible periplasmic protein
MFRTAIIAIAAGGLLAACAHSRETDATTAEKEAAERDGYAATTYAKPIDTRAEVESQKVEPDNTAVNKRDKKDEAVTPLDQGNSGTDLKITQEIRKAVVGADGLSFTAKNVKIITRDSNVTLRGPVKTSSEKARIDELARGCAGVTRVDNQLEVESTN